MKTYLTFALTFLALLAFSTVPASGQITFDKSSDPPPFLPDENITVTAGSETTMEVGPFGQSVGWEISYTEQDVINIWGTIWEWLTGGGNEGGDEGGEGGEEGGDQTPEGGDGTDVDVDSDEDQDTDTDSNTAMKHSGGSSNGTVTVGEYVDVRSVRVTKKAIVIDMGDEGINSFSTNKDLQVPAVFLRDLGVRGTKFVPAGTYRRVGGKLVLPLKGRR